MGCCGCGGTGGRAREGNTLTKGLGRGRSAPAPPRLPGGHEDPEPSAWWSQHLNPARPLPFPVPLLSCFLPYLASQGAHPHPPPGPAGAPPPAAACGHWNPCRPGTQLTADRQWYFPSAWVSGAGLIQRCFSISLTPHCPALIAEMLMSCLAWKWFLHLGARTASL